MTTTARPCKSVTKQGKPCAGRCLPGKDFCLFHDPSKAAERAAARRAGGKARHGRKITPPASGEQPETRIETVADVLAIVTRAINDTLVLENSNQRNRTLGTLSMAALKAFEISELEQRVLAVEELVNSGRVQRNGYQVAT